MHEEYGHSEVNVYEHDTKEDANISLIIKRNITVWLPCLLIKGKIILTSLSGLINCRYQVLLQVSGITAGISPNMMRIGPIPYIVTITLYLDHNINLEFSPSFPAKVSFI